jgi:hypothetical protein
MVVVVVVMDRKWAKQNIKSSRHLSNDLNKHNYSHALKDISKIERRLSGIRREIKSGKARRE